MTETILRCPHCGADLHWGEKQVSCDHGHQFDRARQGYANLYIPTGRHPDSPGDTKRMLQARRSFLEAGYFEPLLKSIRALLANKRIDIIADAGCGEGYYLRRLTGNGTIKGYGFDRSKDAVRLAAGRDKRNRYFVADSWQPLLFADDSIDLLLNIFAPRNPAEFARILRPTGHLLVVIPGPQHLETMRSKFGLLSQQAHKEDALKDALAPSFFLVSARRLTFSIKLTGGALKTLVDMTPAHHHLNKTQQKAVQSTIEFTVETDFRLSLWQPILQGAA